MIMPSLTGSMCVAVEASSVSDESQGVSQSGSYFSEGIFTGLISSPSPKAVSVKRAKCLERSCACSIVAPGTGSPCSCRAADTAKFMLAGGWSQETMGLSIEAVSCFGLVVA